MAYYSPYTQVLLDTQTASSSASLSFTSKITSSYSLYLLIFSNIIPATDNVVLQLLFRQITVQPIWVVVIVGHTQF